MSTKFNALIVLLTIFSSVAHALPERKCSNPVSTNKQDIMQASVIDQEKICIDNDDFSVADLIDITKAGLKISISTVSTHYSVLELLEIAPSGNLEIYVSDQRLSDSDLKTLEKAGATLLFMNLISPIHQLLLLNCSCRK